MCPYRGVILALVRGLYAEVVRGVCANDVLAVRQPPTCAVREHIQVRGQILVREHTLTVQPRSRCTPGVHVCCRVPENTF